jgi:flagellar hook-associated protein 1 FlgK
MSGFGVSMSSAAGALAAIQRALDGVQNNIVNASTPGYAAERVDFSARPFDVTQGLMGGVEASLSSLRDQYLEQAVRNETSSLGLLEQASPLASSLQTAFNATGESGIPGAISSFAAAFAALAASPDDLSARSNAIQSAATVAQSFQQTAAQITQVADESAQQASSTAIQINTLVDHLALLNAKIQKDARNDAGVAADVTNTLDSLSELVNISVTNNADGSVSVLLDGQTPLVLGSRASSLSVVPATVDPAAPYPQGDAGIRVLAGSGAGSGDDVTAQVSQGKLGALLQMRNQAVPYYLGGQTQSGELNDLAKSFASRVNQIITDAQTAAGVPVSALFAYNGTDDTKVASSLALGCATASQLVMSDGTSSNGVATELGGIANPTNNADLMPNGQTFSAYYAQLAAKAGRDASQGLSDLQTQQDVTTQAQNQRTQASGVSLNDQAAQLLTLQQAYQATARIITILNTLSETAVNIIPQA